MRFTLCPSIPNRSNFSHPPSNQSTIILSKVFRFKAAAASTGVDVTPRCLGDLLMVADTADTGQQVATSVRIARVEMWGPVASDLAPVTVQAEWAGAAGLVGPSARVTDSSMGSTMPAHLRSRPPSGSLAHYWHGSTATDVLLRLSFPINTIVDVEVQLSLNDTGTAVPVTGVVALATPGALYCRALTSPTSLTLLAPVGLATL